MLDLNEFAKVTEYNRFKLTMALFKHCMIDGMVFHATQATLLGWPKRICTQQIKALCTIVFGYSIQPLAYAIKTPLSSQA